MIVDCVIGLIFSRRFFENYNQGEMAFRGIIDEFILVERHGIIGLWNVITGKKRFKEKNLLKVLFLHIVDNRR